VICQVFWHLVQVLLQGKALSIEDTVDGLTLKDNTSTPEDFATALHLLACLHVHQHPNSLL
jgi:nuclear pore complex protein Nup133